MNTQPQPVRVLKLVALGAVVAGIALSSVSVGGAALANNSGPTAVTLVGPR